MAGVRTKLSRFRSTSNPNGEGMVSDDAAEFGRAIERYKREKQRPHPTYAEVLQVAKALGYKKVAP